MNSLVWVYLGLILALVTLFFAKKVVQKGLVWITGILCIVSVISAISGVFIPRAFVALADVTLERNGTLETIRSVDEKLPLEKVIVPVQNLFDKIKSIWNKVPTEPKSGQQEKLGVLEAEVYPTLVSTTANFYRGVALVFAVLGLILSIYLNYSLANISEIEQLRKRIAVLEKKLDN